MRLRLFVLLALLCFLVSAPTSAQTPCEGPLTFTLVNGSTLTLAQTVSDFSALFGGQPVVTDFEFVAVAKGAPPTSTPVASGATVKSGWTLAPGATSCYVGTVTLTPAFPLNVELDLYSRSKGATVGPWVGAAVPFGKAGPPAATSNLRIVGSK